MAAAPLEFLARDLLARDFRAGVSWPGSGAGGGEPPLGRIATGPVQQLGGRRAGRHLQAELGRLRTQTGE